ncbi:MAG: threonine--tRNA ligase [Candidatus Doudnabacteria bacterium CG10_big_fil_rev_8_21_14_0_10_42_18]|uniref:Threonine--tRNA ligase n=1 Tax=Candidatus Doudnabacteria bacterium CG10_big_fil_rev_8_21_14_0_10_42_18 TaxID=1974552 RepID=A0A2H0VAW4_9BACT|nr:MAG: threonine--tRNA ligase [Candidatus Doudnabacteria bacterium CG10_big_fil_rev_8_21_14_0_10_42_18]
MNNQNLHNIRHTLAHLFAAALLKLHPKAKVTIGPPVENGFYYDVDLDEKLTAQDLPKIEKQMRKLLPTWEKFERKEVSPDEAKKYWSGNPYKLELINELEKLGEKITFYTAGDFTDLCRGGHVDSPKKDIKADAFKLTKLAGAYWRGDEKNKMLTRVYGVAFETKVELDSHLKMLEEAEKRDHRILGKQLDLFTFSELVGAGLPLWTPKGTLLRNLLDDYLWRLRKNMGFEKVEIPHITKKDLYETSGHWGKFKNELFRIQTREGHEFAMKPMNCPHHTQIYARKQHSYRELPVRYANTTMVYRDEQTGELNGLSRVRCITQDDAHIFCRFNQTEKEISALWEVIKKFYKASGNFELKIRLSLHDPKNMKNYLGSEEVWQKAETELRKAITSKKVRAEEAVGEAAFYGPKIDFMAKDSLGRQWQVATIQLDMNMPENFDLSCVNEKGEAERVVMLHCAVMGSIERYLAILIEHLAGKFPLWLSPVQVAVLPISKKQNKYAKDVLKQLSANYPELRIVLDDRDESVGKKIREATLQKIPYQIIVGEKEVKSKKVSVRTREGNDLGQMTVKAFIQKINAEIEKKK